MKQRYFLNIFIPALLGAGMFFSCQRSRKEIEEVAYSELGAPEELDTVASIMFKEGESVAVLYAAKIERYQHPKQTIFPEGIEVVYYDSLNEPETTLTADSAVHLESQLKFEVFQNVVMRNIKEDRIMYTEHLIWERRGDSGKVHTNEFVRILDRGDEHIGRKGVVTDEKFTYYDWKGYSYDPNDTTATN